MRTLLLLILAAGLEVGGDALMRKGLRSEHLRVLLLAGAAVLAAYGVIVNLSTWDFGRLLGVYIVVFFVVAQVAAGLLFRERPSLPVLVGGGLIAAGGVVMTCWHPT